MGTKVGYQDLVVWQRAIDLVPTVYAAIRNFPPHENFALSAQIRRSAVSISANIAEGQGRQHRKEFLQHLSIAKGSLAELHSLMTVAHRLGYLDMTALEELETALSGVRRPLTGLVDTLAKSRR
ncbi:MAG: four helix bundle protein [Rhodanobacteraceae bacterium]|nr:four helix bundle protein [Rhodanobacteraceae bacterium]